MGRNGGRQRSKTQKALHQREAARLHLLGKTQEEIAALLNISQQTVSNDLAEIADLWRERAAGDVKVEKGKALARLDLLIAEYFAGWERSQRGVETTQTDSRNTQGRGRATTRPAPPPAPDSDGPAVVLLSRDSAATETTQEHSGSLEGASIRRVLNAGDPAFLQGLERVIKLQMDIMGISVHKIAPTSPDGSKEYDSGSIAGIRDQLLARLAGLADAGATPGVGGEQSN